MKDELKVKIVRDLIDDYYETYCEDDSIKFGMARQLINSVDVILGMEQEEESNGEDRNQNC